MRTTNEDNDYSREFQAIAEAYAVLSVRQSRNAYDLSNQRQADPNLVYSQDRQQYIRSQSITLPFIPS